MKKFEITWIDTGKTKVLSKRQANKVFGEEEFKELLQFGAPHIVVVGVA